MAATSMSPVYALLIGYFLFPALFSASASHPRRSFSAGTLDRYGLMSSTGVPSSMSTPRTCNSITFARQQLHHRQPDRIRPSRRSRREYAVGRPFIRWRMSDQIESIGAVELPQHIQMRKAFYVEEPRCEFSRSNPMMPSVSCLAPRPLGIALKFRDRDCE